jgi:signal peptidase I
MDTPQKTHAPWVGVVLSFFISGAGLFFAGARRKGLCWFAGIHFAHLLVACLIASTLIENFILHLILLSSLLALWILMLIKSYKPIPRLKLSTWSLFIVTVLLCGNFLPLLKQNFVRPFKLPTGAMSPTLNGVTLLSSGQKKSGDHVFCQRFAYWFSDPKRGDIIVFDTSDLEVTRPGEIFVKRLVGLPGDHLKIQRGFIRVNGEILDDPPIFKKLEYSHLSSSKHLQNEEDEFIVPEGHYFVLGDNSANSFDSRFWGPIPEKSIIGKVTKIYWPLDRFGVPE